MSAWSRTTKPSADTTIAANTIFGVDRSEIAVTPIPSHVGWVKRTTVGNRVKTEVLVAMKTPPVEDNADDTVFPDTVITIGTQPASVTRVAGQTATFTVVATAAPTATLTYQWQKQESGAGSWTDVSGATLATHTTGALTVLADNTDKYRVIVSGTNTGVSVTSAAATLTVTAS
jgi:hypothetical protein